MKPNNVPKDDLYEPLRRVKLDGYDIRPKVKGYGYIYYLVSTNSGETRYATRKAAMLDYTWYAKHKLPVHVGVWVQWTDKFGKDRIEIVNAIAGYRTDELN